LIAEQLKLVAWTEWHAAFICIGTLVSVVGFSPFFLALLAAGSFGLLVWIFRFGWSSTNGFGLANAITLTRLLGILVLFTMPPTSAEVLIPVALALFAMDGFDGYVARKLGLSSEFGEYFDKEVDAFFMLVLCLMLYSTRSIGGWILIPGLLRYTFVFFLKWAKPPQSKEQRSRVGISIYIVTMSALIFCFAPFPKLVEALAFVVTLLLCGSFADTIYRLYRTPRAGIKS